MAGGHEAQEDTATSPQTGEDERAPKSPLVFLFLKFPLYKLFLTAYNKGTLFLIETSDIVDRTILHVDMNSFYASVECLYHPEIREKPVAVVGDAEQRHGIILAKNQHAKKYGIATGEAIWQAKAKCKDLVCVTAHYDLYLKVSETARKIYSRYTDQIEPFGLDECWLDLTGNVGIVGTGECVADEIRSTIEAEIGVTASVGVSWNKIFAKLGSDYKKPDATTVISRDNYKDIAYPLPASDLLYVGRATNRKLASYGIHTIGQLAETDPDFLRCKLGKWGEYLWAFASGHDISPVANQGHVSPIKSIGNSMTTWRDMTTDTDVYEVYLALSESVCRRLRENGFRARTVQISVRDNELQWFECQSKLSSPCCTVSDITGTAMSLFKRHCDMSKPLRSVGVRACDLVDMSSGLQASLFDDDVRRVRWETIETCVDKVRGRFGRASVVRAALLGADIIGESDPLTHDVHPVGYFGR